MVLRGRLWTEFSIIGTNGFAGFCRVILSTNSLRKPLLGQACVIQKVDETLTVMTSNSTYQTHVFTLSTFPLFRLWLNNGIDAVDSEHFHTAG